MMFSWQRLLLCNIPREGGGDNQGSSVGEPSNDTPDTVGPNDPGLSGLSAATSKDSVASFNTISDAVPGFGKTVGEALGNTALGSFGFSGVTSNTSAPGTSTPFSGAVTDPGAVPGYEGSGTTVSGTTFGKSEAPDLGNLGPDRTSGANSVLADPAVTSLSYDRVGAQTNINPTVASTTAPKATETPAPPVIGTTTGKATAVASPVTAAPTATPTANSSTTKGPGVSVTGLSLVDDFLSGLVNNPVAAITGLAVGAVNPIAGAINTFTGNPIGNGVSGLLGTGSGYGNTVTSSTNPDGSINPNGPNPSTTDLGPSGGGGITEIPIKPTATTLSSYDLTNDRG